MQRFSHRLRAIALAAVATLLGACVPNEPMVLSSPNKALQVHVQVDHNNSLIYFISHNGKQVLRESHLGLALDGQDFTSGITLGEITRAKKLKPDQAKLGDSQAFSRGAREKIFTLINRDNAVLRLRLRVGDKGVAVQYASDTPAILVREATSLSVAPDAQLQIPGSPQPINLIDTDVRAQLPLQLRAGGFGFVLREIAPPNAKTKSDAKAQSQLVTWPMAAAVNDGLQAELVLAPELQGDAETKASLSNWRVLEIDLPD